MQEYLEIADLGSIGYAEANDIQNALVQQRLSDSIGDRLLLLEHPPVLTYTKRGGTKNLLVTPEQLKQRGVQLVETDRGGDITFHGPGQLVGYLIYKLDGRSRSVPDLFLKIEAGIRRVLEDLGVESQGGTQPSGELSQAGVWIGNDKVCSIGMRLSRWVTKHGFALNADLDLEYFKLVVACGLKQRGMTSITQQLGRKVTVDDLKPQVAEALGWAFKRQTSWMQASS